MTDIKPPTGNLGDHLGTFFGPGRIHYRVIIDQAGDWRGDQSIHAAVDKRSGELTGLTRDIVEDRLIKQTPETQQAIDRFDAALKAFAATPAVPPVLPVDQHPGAGEFRIGAYDNDAKRGLTWMSGRIAETTSGPVKELLDAAAALYPRI